MGNIVAQYTPSVFSTIGKASIVVLVMFSYPLQVHPCRASVDAVSKWRPTRATRGSSDEYTPASGSPSRSSLLNGQQRKLPVRPKPEDMSELRFAIITTVIIILSYIVAMTVSSLDKVLAYVGSTGSTSISFILPGLFYYKISSPDSLHHQRLLKDEEDEEYEGSSGEESHPSSPVGGEGGWGSKMKGRQWRRKILRRLSLALAGYGLLVMVAIERAMAGSDSDSAIRITCKVCKSCDKQHYMYAEVSETKARGSAQAPREHKGHQHEDPRHRHRGLQRAIQHFEPQDTHLNRHRLPDDIKAVPN
ncbi:hypothetical protein LTR53_018081 [Teratosphaeriaceae sp. CCFEE 6253]|nr:hypothetical protein LTR53_018081 [Teratosphaeriaceae sp. CCFEE 6253]